MIENHATNKDLPQLCPKCRTALYLSETLGNIDVWFCPNVECRYEDRSGLTMEGLSFETQCFCRGIHKAFLTKNGLAAWPLKVSVTAIRRAPNQPQRFFLEIRYGPMGGVRRLTENPESDLKRDLEAEMESRFKLAG